MKSFPFPFIFERCFFSSYERLAHVYKYNFASTSLADRRTLGMEELNCCKICWNGSYVSVRQPRLLLLIDWIPHGRTLFETVPNLQLQLGFCPHSLFRSIREQLPHQPAGGWQLTVNTTVSSPFLSTLFVVELAPTLGLFKNLARLSNFSTSIWYLSAKFLIS